MTPSPGIEPGPHWWEASALPLRRPCSPGTLLPIIVGWGCICLKWGSGLFWKRPLVGQAHFGLDKSLEESSKGLQFISNTGLFWNGGMFCNRGSFGWKSFLSVMEFFSGRLSFFFGMSVRWRRHCLFLLWTDDSFRQRLFLL